MSSWTDYHWLHLLQLYLLKPLGVKAAYARPTVALAMQLHVEPSELHERMETLHAQSLPSMRRLLHTYGSCPRRLRRDIKRAQSMAGFGNAAVFYDGVEVRETFELTFRPVAPGEVFTPMMLTMVLNAYFHLAPPAMVEDTPEVRELSRLMGVDAGRVVEALRQFRLCDPFVRRPGVKRTPLLPHCQKVWREHEHMSLEQLEQLAHDYRAYFAR